MADDISIELSINPVFYLEMNIVAEQIEAAVDAGFLKRKSGVKVFESILTEKLPKYIEFSECS